MDRDIELVLGSIPEQAWMFDLPVNGVDLPVEVPMRVRREIIRTVLTVGEVQGG